jgi:hypothetical protein
MVEVGHGETAWECWISWGVGSTFGVLNMPVYRSVPTPNTILTGLVQTVTPLPENRVRGVVDVTRRTSAPVGK